jgi:hypothetical protein
MRSETIGRQISGETKENVDYHAEVRIYGDSSFYADIIYGRIYSAKEGLEAICNLCGRKMLAANVEELKYVIKAHDQEHAELSKFLHSVADKLEQKLQRELSDKYVYVGIDSYSQFLSIEIGVKFDEISESVAEGFDDYCADHELSEEECEKEYYEAYEEELRGINEEWCVNISGKIVLPYMEIRFSPKEVEHDYDWAGLFVEIHFTTTTPWENIAENDLVELIFSLVATVYQLA